MECQDCLRGELKSTLRKLLKGLFKDIIFLINIRLRNLDSDVSYVTSSYESFILSYFFIYMFLKKK